MLELDERPQVLVFGEANDRSILLLFPARELREIVKRGVLKDFPFASSEGTRYEQNGKIVQIQYRISLLYLPRLERVLAPYMELRWLRDTSDKDNPQRT